MSILTFPGAYQKGGAYGLAAVGQKSSLVPGNRSEMVLACATSNVSAAVELLANAATAYVNSHIEAKTTPSVVHVADFGSADAVNSTPVIRGVIAAVRAKLSVDVPIVVTHTGEPLHVVVVFAQRTFRLSRSAIQRFLLPVLGGAKAWLLRVRSSGNCPHLGLFN